MKTTEPSPADADDADGAAEADAAAQLEAAAPWGLTSTGGGTGGPGERGGGAGGPGHLHGGTGRSAMTAPAGRLSA